MSYKSTVILINKLDYKIFKGEGCKHYHILGKIFSGTTANGGLDNASTQIPATLEEERRLEDNFFEHGSALYVWKMMMKSTRFPILAGVRKLVHRANDDVMNLR
ncbi:hypothetical protein Fot_42397 [Forsythia ovata]|uniref:Uncharacterized protein n=1 Tax=Forsythia ovata TaxID=205694 RepID=A0ABD1RL25_9LAMI